MTAWRANACSVAKLWKGGRNEIFGPLDLWPNPEFNGKVRWDTGVVRINWTRSPKNGHGFASRLAVHFEAARREFLIFPKNCHSAYASFLCSFIPRTRKDIRKASP